MANYLTDALESLIVLKTFETLFGADVLSKEDSDALYTYLFNALNRDIEEAKNQNRFEQENSSSVILTDAEDEQEAEEAEFDGEDGEEVEFTPDEEVVEFINSEPEIESQVFEADFEADPDPTNPRLSDIPCNRFVLPPFEDGTPFSFADANIDGVDVIFTTRETFLKLFEKAVLGEELELELA